MRFILVTANGTVAGEWDEFDVARDAVLPIKSPTARLVDTKTGLFWTSEGLFK